MMFFGLTHSIYYDLSLIFFCFKILDIDSGVPRVPPASKEVVAKLPVTTVTEEILSKLGTDAACSICQESLVVEDQMQELPCKHMFHPPCLKPWLVPFIVALISQNDVLIEENVWEIDSSMYVYWWYQTRGLKGTVTPLLLNFLTNHIFLCIIFMHVYLKIYHPLEFESLILPPPSQLNIWLLHRLMFSSNLWVERMNNLYMMCSIRSLISNL